MPNQRPVLEERFSAFDGDVSVSQSRISADRLQDIERSECDMALEAPVGQAYNEEAFRYFLEIERKRSEISSRPFLLLLIDLKKPADPDVEPRMGAATAEQLFAALGQCLRETDFVGWYREGRVAGAVLTQDSETAAAGLSDIVARRVTSALQTDLRPDISQRLQVRVYQLPANGTRQSQL